MSRSENPQFSWKLWQHLAASPSTRRSKGFTLVELLIVISIIAALAVVSVPGWLTFINRRKINTVHENMIRVLQEAKSLAQNRKISYSVSFRMRNGFPEAAVHRSDLNPFPAANNNIWQRLTDTSIRANQVIFLTNLETQQNSPPSLWLKTDVNRLLTSNVARDYGTVTFDHRGAMPDGSTLINNRYDGIYMQVSMQSNNRPLTYTKRCAVIQTIVGNIQPARTNECALNR